MVGFSNDRTVKPGGIKAKGYDEVKTRPAEPGKRKVRNREKAAREGLRAHLRTALKSLAGANRCGAKSHSLPNAGILPAQTWTLSVSLVIVAGSDDSSKRRVVMGDLLSHNPQRFYILQAR